MEKPINADDLTDSWIMAWLTSWGDSPIGEGLPVNLEMLVEKDDFDGKSYIYSIAIELNASRGVALVYEDDELTHRIFHHELS